MEDFHRISAKLSPLKVIALASNPECESGAHTGFLIGKEFAHWD
jgi:hypothetical protein